MTVILGLASIGFGLSFYAYFVEQKIKHDAKYKPYCDISDRISCSKVARSPYANLFFVSNALVGMWFYAFVMMLAVLRYNQLLFVVTASGALFSIYLAYILYAKVNSFCLICTTIYVLNFALFIYTCCY